MIKLRLLRLRPNDFQQLLEEVELPDIDSLDELFIIAGAAGRLLKPYAESLKDPNVVSVLLDGSVKDWSIPDLESLNISLAQSKLQLLITKEVGPDLTMTNSQVKYLMIDSSTRFLSGIPYSYSQVVDRREAIDNMKIIDVIQAFIDKFNYFSKNKFVSNPIKTLLDQLFESRELLGTINSSAMTRLNWLLQDLNKKLYVISQS